MVSCRPFDTWPLSPTIRTVYESAMSNQMPPYGQPPQPYGQSPYGQPPQQPYGSSQGFPQAPPVPTKPARWWGGYVSLGMLALSFMLGIGTGIAAAMSESLGVSMSYLAVGPFAFGVIGTIVALVTKKNPNQKVAVGAPIGCGCLSWIVAVAMLFVFMVAIFPSL